MYNVPGKLELIRQFWAINLTEGDHLRI